MKKRFNQFLILAISLILTNLKAQCIADSDSPQWSPLPVASAIDGTFSYGSTSVSATVDIINGGATTFANTLSGLDVATLSKAAAGTLTATFSKPISKPTATETFKIFGIGTSEAQIVTATNASGNTVYPTFVFSASNNVAVSGTNKNEIAGSALGLSGNAEFSFSVPIISLKIEPKAGVMGALNVSFLKICATSSLPIELVFFRAKPINNVVKLTWQTASEKNNKGFEIERSVDIKTWENIGGVKGKGNSEVLIDYTFEDKDPLPIVSGQIRILTYYRLKQVDFDGKENYSKVISVYSDKNKAAFSVFPNPVNGKSATVSLDDDLLEGILIVTNSIGSVAKKEKITSNNFNLDLSNLSNGLYIFEIQKEQNRSFQRVLIEE